MTTAITVSKATLGNSTRSSSVKNMNFKIVLMAALGAISVVSMAQTLPTAQAHRIYTWNSDLGSGTGETNNAGGFNAAFQANLNATVVKYIALANGIGAEVTLKGYDSTSGSKDIGTLQIRSNASYTVSTSNFTSLAYSTLNPNLLSQYGSNASGILNTTYIFEFVNHTVTPTFGGPWAFVPSDTASLVPAATPAPYEFNVFGEAELHLKATLNPATNNPEGLYTNTGSITITVI